MLAPTPRAAAAMAVGIPVAAAAGLVDERLWVAGPAWAAAALVLLLVDAALCRRPRAFTLSPDIPGVVEVGRTTGLAFLPEGRAPARLEAILEADPRLAPSPLPDPLPTPLPTPLRFTLRPNRRGTARLHRLHLRWPGPLGLVRRTEARPLARDILVVPQIGLVREQALRWFARDRAAGRAPVHALADSAEFHALRAFQPGDNRRGIDWRRSARHAELLVRETEDERNRTIILAIDTGRLMSEPLADGLPRLDHALHGALLLAFAGLRLGDRVGLFAFAAKPTLSSGTVANPASFAALQRLAASIEYSAEETNFTYGLTGLAAQLNTRALVVVFTDFADSTGAELLLENVARLLHEHVVIFVALRDDALEAMEAAPPTGADAVARAVVAASLLTEREAVLARLRRLGADVLEARPGSLGPALVARYLRGKRRDLL